MGNSLAAAESRGGSRTAPKSRGGSRTAPTFWNATLNSPRSIYWVAGDCACWGVPGAQWTLITHSTNHQSKLKN